MFHPTLIFIHILGRLQDYLDLVILLSSILQLIFSELNHYSYLFKFLFSFFVLKINQMIGLKGYNIIPITTIFPNHNLYFSILNEFFLSEHNRLLF